MKRLIRVTAIVATVALSGTVAFAVAASSAPPRVDHIATVVTDRPVRESALSPASTATTDAASAPQAKPSAIAPTASQTTSLRTVVRSVVSPRGNPQVIQVPGIHVDPPATTAHDHSDHEVVTPPVRDDSDEHQDKHDNGSTTDSVHKRTFNSFDEKNSSTKGD
jgi:hypothetical protein